MEMALIAGLGPVFVFCMLLLVIFLCKSQGYESGQKRAGRQGENYVCDLICQVLKEKDLLFSNIMVLMFGLRDIHFLCRVIRRWTVNRCWNQHRTLTM